MISINTVKQVFQSSRFKIESVEYSQDGSELFQRDVIRHPGAVVILPILADGKLIFVSQERLALKIELMELPAGTREPNEDALECAKRELAEETGFAATEWIAMGEMYPAPGFCDEKQILYVARGLSEYKLQPDPEEKISVHTFTKEQVLQLVKDGTLKDAKSLALLLKAQVAGLW